MDLILLFRFMDAWWAEIYQKNGDSSWIKMMMKWGQMSLLNWLIAYSLLHCFICCWVIRKRPLVLFTKSISINRIAIVIRDAFHFAFWLICYTQNTSSLDECFVWCRVLFSSNFSIKGSISISNYLYLNCCIIYYTSLLWITFETYTLKI